MSESKTRTSTDIQQEYSQLALKAGQASYQLSMNQKELDLYHKQMQDLNLEFASVKAAEINKAPVAVEGEKTDAQA